MAEKQDLSDYSPVCDVQNAIQMLSEIPFQLQKLLPQRVEKKCALMRNRAIRSFFHREFYKRSNLLWYARTIAFPQIGDIEAEVGQIMTFNLHCTTTIMIELFWMQNFIKRAGPMQLLPRSPDRALINGAARDFGMPEIRYSKIFKPDTTNIYSVSM